MSKRVLATVERCSACRYHAGFGSQPGKDQKVNQNICCNYWSVKGHSRIFENGRKAYDPKYCNKFEPGEPNNIGWTADSMGIWVDEDDKRRNYWKELEDARYK